MAVMERDVVLTGRDADGNTTLDLPVTRLGNIEDSAEEKSSPASADYIPVMDSTDNGRMKKTTISALLYGVQTQMESLIGAFVERELTISTSAWVSTSAYGRHKFYADIAVNGLSDCGYYSVEFDRTNGETARSCGLSNADDAPDGKIRFLAQVKPTAAINGVCLLWRTGSENMIPVATGYTVGGIKSSDSVLIDTDGTAHAALSNSSFATDEEVRNMLNDVYGE